MSSNFDWSKFEEVSAPNNNESKSGFDWQKYAPIEQNVPSVPDNRNIVEKVVNKGARLATQATIGQIQRHTAPFDVAAILSSKLSGLTAPQQFRQDLFEDIEMMQDQKARGEWSPEDQKRYDSLVDLIKNPEKMESHLPKDPPSFDVGSLIEKGAKQFGVDLSPQGVDEMALRWIGFIKDPTKAQNLIKNGVNPQNVKEIAKALLPTGKEAVRGLGASTALQYAAEAELGPIGTMAAVVIGDMAPSLAFSGAKGAFNFSKNPIENTKRGLAKTVAALTPRDKVSLQQAIIKDFRDAGLQADLGTASGNAVVKWLQSTLQQSALTGRALEEFKTSLSKNIVSEYKNLAGELGESLYESRYEAGEALKSGLKEARELDIGEARKLYNSARQRAGEAQVFTGNVGNLITELENDLAPGAVKSPEQKAVLDIINQVKRDVMTPQGGIKSASINELINDKIALNDIIDYEIQGGTKQLLKRLVKEIDTAIESHGKTDPQFSKEWREANARFSKHAQLFRGKVISEALKTQDPSQVLGKMSTPHGIEQVKKALNGTAEGRQLFRQLARYKLEEMIGKNLVDGTTNQVKFGTFSKLLEKNQNRQIVQSLMGKDSLARLERIQKASGRLAETAQKFLNTSRSGVHAADLAAAGKLIHDISAVFSGNPWPLLKTGGALFAGRKLAQYFADPEFIRMVEDIILEAESGSPGALQRAGIRLGEKFKDLAEPAQAAVLTPPESKQNQSAPFPSRSRLPGG